MTTRSAGQISVMGVHLAGLLGRPPPKTNACTLCPANLSAAVNKSPTVIDGIRVAVHRLLELGAEISEGKCVSGCECKCGRGHE